MKCEQGRAPHRQMQSDSLAGETLYITTKTQGEPASLWRGGEFVSTLFVLRHQTIAPCSPDDERLKTAQHSTNKSCLMADIMCY